MNKPLSRTPVALALIAALTFTASSVLQAETAPAATTAPATTTAVTPAPAATPEAAPTKDAESPIAVERGTAVQNQAAMDALTAIQKASEAVGKKDIKAAQTALTEADTHLKAIKDSLPTAKIKKTLDAAKANPNTADWTSIYQELDKITVFLPTQTAKNATDGSKPADASAKPAAPSAESIDAALVALQYTEIDLPVATTIKAVEKAQAALHKENLDAAGKDLKAAENSVVVLQSLVEEPLYQAHFSLWQALANLKNGTVSDAKRYLDDAIGFLEKAASATDKASKEAADKLLTEGKDLKAAIEKVASNTASATEQDTASLSSKLEHFGLRTEAWSERAINYAYTKSSEAINGGDALKHDLIEARFHLSNAAIDLTMAQDAATTKTDMEQAKASLGKALQQTDDLWVDNSYKKQVTDLQTTLDSLLQDPGKTNAAQLHTLGQTLQSVILSL
ncbi:MAG: hypothetical protein BWK73_10200 [Thiothrix lacustris]|uniref:YfdX family protein n=1 Tax=Thiothrix lacustris TaxID=525917 RepID=A0A1Y1QV26_9GAMM|nr:MAG: hypothetical protein BWK73_10200 [Thiothrix lacustris]